MVSKGNNKVGRKGILRCEACRKIHSKVTVLISTIANPISVSLPPTRHAANTAKAMVFPAF